MATLQPTHEQHQEDLSPEFGGDGEQPTFRKHTDLGNAERLADRAHGKLLWVYGNGWLYWDGKRWLHDEAKRAERLAAETVRSIYDEAAAISKAAADADDPAESEKLGEIAKATVGWAKHSEGRSRIEAMLKLGQAQRRLVLEGGAKSLDADPDALNVANGMLDLNTYELTPHEPEAHHTRIASAAYDPEATSPEWDAFLEKILPSEELRRYVQKAIGSSLRGQYSEHLLIPWGSGKNGKSTMLRGIRHSAGDYAMEAAPELLVRKGGTRNAGDLAAMADVRGRRFVTTIETGQGHRLDETFVKQITGEHVLKAKFMRQDFFEFINQTTVCLATNHKPQVQGADIAIWERLAIAPFTVYVRPEDRDPDLGKKLESPENSAAILNWLVEGLRLYDKEGLVPPQEVVEATAEYQQEMDPLYSWFDANCELDPSAVTPVAWLMNSYAYHCETTRTSKLLDADLRQALLSRGLTKPSAAQRYAGKSRKVWKGVRLIDEEAHAQAEQYLTVMQRAANGPVPDPSVN